MSDVVVSALQESQVSSLAVTLLAAMVPLVVSFGLTHRRPFLGVVTIAPVALVVLWTFGAMAATGVPLGPVTTTIAAHAVGIGVPYTIHVTTRFTEDRRLVLADRWHEWRGRVRGDGPRASASPLAPGDTALSQPSHRATTSSEPPSPPTAPAT